MFVHMVFFWLKPDATDAAREQCIADCTGLLGQVPGVQQVWAGRPAMTPREVVDNSYDVGLCVVLDSRASHDVYQTHPLHLEFIARNKPAWDRVRVYDFE